MRIRFPVLIFFLLLSFYYLAAIPSFPGIPIITNYNRADYKAGAQNYSACQDQRGRMYFGNGMGVLIFSGNQWQIVPVSNKSYVRSLAVDANDRVYVGAYQEFGYLDYSPQGEYVYVSLSSRIQELTDHFADIWKIGMIGDMVYFQSKNILFLYENDSLQLVEPANEFEFAFQTSAKLYITEKNRGLYELINKNLVQPAFGSFFSNNEIQFLFEKPDHSLLIGTHENGLFEVRDNSVLPVSSSFSKLLMKDKITCGLQVSDRLMAVGTVQNGVYLVDYEGNVKYNLNTSTNLQDNTIQALFYDQESNLWIMHANGIDYADLASGNYIVASDIGSGYASALIGSALYLGTNRGLYRGDFFGNTGTLGHFQLVPGTVGQVWTLFPLLHGVLVGHHLGSFYVDESSSSKMSDVMGHWQFFELKNHPGYLLSGTYSGYVLYKIEGDRVSFVRKLEGFDESCRVSVQDEQGDIWMSHGWKGIYHLHLKSDLTGFESVTYFNEKNGLPSNLNNDVFVYKSSVYISTIEGVYTFSEDKKKLVYSAGMSEYLKNPHPLTKILVAPDNSIWNFSDGQAGRLEVLTDSIYYNDYQFLSTLENQLIPAFESVNWYNQRDALLGTQDGFVHWSATPSSTDQIKLVTEIYSFEAVGEGISLQKGSNYFLVDSMKAEALEIPYSANTIRLLAGINSFMNPQSVSYSSLLEGVDAAWSVWNTNPLMEFNRLKEGSYVLYVKARTHQLKESAPVRLQFTILPPWYRTWFAYFSVVLLVGFAAFGLRWAIHRRERHIKHQLLEKQYQQNLQQEAINRDEKERSEQELIRLRNEKLRDEVIHKSKELANSAQHIIHKNQILIDLKTDLKMMGEESKNTIYQRKIRQLIHRIDKEMENDQGQEIFQSNFDRIHENFVNEIRKKHPELTPKDLQLCSFLRMNMSTKEIAPMLNISIRGVEISRYRLRKKLGLPHDNNLTDYILNFRLSEDK